MAPTLRRLTAAQRREAMAQAVALARFALALNDLYPFPPDVNHLALEQRARDLLTVLENPARIVRAKGC